MVVGAVVVVLALSGFAAVQWHETPQFCAAFCHLMDPYLASYTGQVVSTRDGSTLMAKAHADEGLACLDCHEPTLEQQVQELVTFVKGDYRTPLDRMRVSDEDCLACKEHASREELIERTADYQMEYTLNEEVLSRIAAAGYDLEGERNTNPHAYPVNPVNPIDPHKEGGPMPECAKCHRMHGESPKIEGCFGCHHSGTFGPCNTCHEQRSRTG